MQKGLLIATISPIEARQAENIDMPFKKDNSSKAPRKKVSDIKVEARKSCQSANPYSPAVGKKWLAPAGQFSSFFSQIKTRSLSADVFKKRTSKKALVLLTGLILLLTLGYLANRYLVVAWVDRKPVTRLEYYNQLDQRYGKSVKDELIAKKLIESETQKRGIVVSGQELDNEIKTIQAEQGGADQLNQILQLQNISQDEFKNLVKLQILRQKMFGQNMAVSDSEVSRYIEQNRTNLPNTTGDASAEAQLKDNVRQQLLQQKINASFSAWLQQNLNSGRVIRVQ